MTDRTFTPDEANKALGEVQPLAEQLTRVRERMRELESAQSKLVIAIGGNGVGRAAGDLEATQSELAGLIATASACIRGLNQLGVLVKDADLGLLDFPALRDGVPVLLCWHVGEAAVEYWHGYEEGFAGRKPIDRGEQWL